MIRAIIKKIANLFGYTIIGSPGVYFFAKTSALGKPENKVRWHDPGEPPTANHE
jgi:hypothetical protein